MNKKTTVVFISVIIISSLIIYTYFSSNNSKLLEQTFVISAVYLENDGYAEISFQDKSNKTKHVSLEILGMPQTFHKEYESSLFIEKIQLQHPKYGWQSMPITFLIDHGDFGKIGIKTEIRPVGENPSKIIFSKDL